MSSAPKRKQDGTKVDGRTFLGGAAYLVLTHHGGEVAIPMKDLMAGPIAMEAEISEDVETGERFLVMRAAPLKPVEQPVLRVVRALPPPNGKIVP